MHWVAHKMLAFDVKCSDGRYRPLSQAINISKAMANRIFADHLDVAEMLGQTSFTEAGLSGNHMSINSSEWKLFNTENTQLFLPRSQKRTRVTQPQPEGPQDSQM